MNKVLVTGGSGFIGTHLIRRLESEGRFEIKNIDINKPILSKQNRFWEYFDIKNDDLMNIFLKFNPSHVFHLAAKANLNGKKVEDFADNVVGTGNVVRATNNTKSIESFVHFSTQYVVRPGIYPVTQDFILPYTAYGESKALGEELIRKECKKPWTILRPTNIWGAMHPFFPNELWYYLYKRYYMHPGRKPIIKYYGYIENAIDQIYTIGIDASPEKVNGQVFYITDPPINNEEWMDAFSLSLSGKPARKIPLGLWKVLAVTGDKLKKLGIPFPMSQERLFRLTVNECVFHEKTISLVGNPKINLTQGVEACVQWYKSAFDIIL